MKYLQRTFRVGRYEVPYILPAALLVIALLSLYGYKVETGTERNIRREFEQIKPMPDAVATRTGTVFKGTHGVISSDFRSEASYQAIRDHYDKELAANGWTFQKEEPVIYRGRDQGGKTALYCKGHYAASLEYAGQLEPELGWTFSFGLSWGLYDC